jgi:hypothetical protein
MLAAHTYRHSFGDSNRDRPSYSNADRERLPRRRVYTITNIDRYSYRHRDTACDSEPHVKSDSDAIAHTGSGIEYLDSIAR